MYETIYVPVDNSDHSNRAVALAVELGRRFGSRMIGCHVYAARMHDYRFRQMEFTLPEEYLEETELERQRKIHDSLITMGLKLISESYLGPMERACREAGLAFEPRMMDGKHSEEIVKDLSAVGSDLVVLGALGIGRTRDSQIGSVCERVTRLAERDVLVVKRLPEEDGAPASDTILVGVDGSPQSFGALLVAVELAKRFEKRVEAVAVYDPYLHYSVFSGIVNVLSEKAAKVFRFEEQNQLHEEIIDTGLAQIYQSHLDVADKMAASHGVSIAKTLLDGKAFQKILDHVRKTNPWLLVLGRIGIHASPAERGLGSNADNLLRLAPVDILLTARTEVPELDLRAEQTIRWTREAEERFRRVPPQVQPIARTAVYRLAIEKGHSVVTSSVLDEAMDRFMPKRAAEATTRLAGEIVLDRAQRLQGVAVCAGCGVAAADPDPVRCSVCGGDRFERISPEAIARILEAEGGASEETTYDGRKLRWTEEARRALWTLEDAYRRRRTKARVEKAARLRKMEAVTLEFVRRFVEEETGEPLALVEKAEAGRGALSPELETGHKIVARDSKNVPLASRFEWTEEAVERLFRVPAGFMRDRTQERIEALARERGVALVDLALVEEGIEHGRKLMAQAIETYQAARRESGSVTSPSAGAPLNEVGFLNPLRK
jgi:nucleotide-binding universal stress UspA family protein